MSKYIIVLLFKPVQKALPLFFVFFPSCSVKLLGNSHQIIRKAMILMLSIPIGQKPAQRSDKFPISYATIIYLFIFFFGSNDKLVLLFIFKVLLIQFIFCSQPISFFSMLERNKSSTTTSFVEIVSKLASSSSSSFF